MTTTLFDLVSTPSGMSHLELDDQPLCGAAYRTRRQFGIVDGLAPSVGLACQTCRDLAGQIHSTETLQNTIREYARSIAIQAGAIEDGTLVGPRRSAVALLISNAQTLLTLIDHEESQR